MNHLNNISVADLNELKNKYQGESLDIALKRVSEGYPIQYLIGDVNFCGNKIIVNENVLIPRYETEFLVELVINTLKDDYSGNILDIGTGSGCISISVAKKLTNSKITAVDISAEAVKVALENCKINNVNNVEVINKDLFEMNNFDGYEIIISNPPYVSFDEEVGEETKYEPQNAIFADDKGLKFYKSIIDKVSKTNTKVTNIFFEIGMNQGSDIISYSTDVLPDYKADIIKDLASKDRYIHIYLNK